MKTTILGFKPGEKWFGAAVSTGHLQPFGSGLFSLDLSGDNLGNQASPLLLSTEGQWVWSESPFSFTFEKGSLLIEPSDGSSEVLYGREGMTLASAYYYCSRNFFPPSGKVPPKPFFSVPQYNTWIELMYNQNESDILKYAENIIAEGYPPGVLMIDDNWQEDYGNWDFSSARFSNPREMIRKLHEMGFRVMLWVCPFVSPDSLIGRKLAEQGILVMEDGATNKDILWTNTENRPALIRWWNGASYVLDLTHPDGRLWFKEQMDYLIKTYDVDGFKLDAGDSNFYRGNLVFHKTGATPEENMELFARTGLDYSYNELRASWKLGGEALVQRLRDKHHKWSDLELLIPHTTVQSLMGHGYTCPDMIGGGEYQSFLGSDCIDGELFVRSAQASALMPMMQFSAAPWRVLDKKMARLCLEAALLHQKFGDLIYEMAVECSRNGSPIFRSMEFNFPHQGYSLVKDQFCLGNTILAAPVLTKGAVQRKILIPPGKWRKPDGSVIEGPVQITEPVSLESLFYFVKEDER